MTQKKGLEGMPLSEEDEGLLGMPQSEKKGFGREDIDTEEEPVSIPLIQDQ